MAKKVLAIIAHTGYQPEEYSVPKKILEEAGFSVDTASNKPGTATASDDKSTAHVDKTLDRIDLNQYDAIYFVGGPGSLENIDSEKSYAIAQTATSLGIPVGAICLAPRILAKSGVLRDKRATGWDKDNALKELYEFYSVHYVPEPVVIDETFVTATGPEVADEFGHALLRVMELHKGWR